MEAVAGTVGWTNRVPKRGQVMALLARDMQYGVNTPGEGGGEDQDKARILEYYKYNAFGSVTVLPVYDRDDSGYSSVNSSGVYDSGIDDIPGSGSRTEWDLVENTPLTLSDNNTLMTNRRNGDNGHAAVGAGYGREGVFESRGLSAGRCNLADVGLIWRCAIAAEFNNASGDVENSSLEEPGHDVEDAPFPEELPFDPPASEGGDVAGPCVPRGITLDWKLKGLDDDAKKEIDDGLKKNAPGGITLDSPEDGDDLGAAVTKANPDGKCIERLNVFGHGKDGKVVEWGDKWSKPSGGGFGGSERDLTSYIIDEKNKFRFCDCGCEIYLYICEFGKNPRLQGLADSTGCKVVTSDDCIGWVGAGDSMDKEDGTVVGMKDNAALGHFPNGVLPGGRGWTPKADAKWKAYKPQPNSVED